MFAVPCCRFFLAVALFFGIFTRGWILTLLELVPNSAIGHTLLRFGKQWEGIPCKPQLQNGYAFCCLVCLYRQLLGGRQLLRWISPEFLEIAACFCRMEEFFLQAVVSRLCTRLIRKCGLERVSCRVATHSRRLSCST